MFFLWLPSLSEFSYNTSAKDPGPFIWIITGFGPSTFTPSGHNHTFCCFLANGLTIQPPPPMPTLIPSITNAAASDWITAGLASEGRPLAYAIFAHCFTCTKNIKAAAHISRSLTKQRIAVLRFDFTGLGESEGISPRPTSPPTSPTCSKSLATWSRSSIRPGC